MLSDGLKDFDEYLDRYCRSRGKTKAEAIGDAVVVEVGRYYGIDDKDISHFLQNISGEKG